MELIDKKENKIMFLVESKESLFNGIRRYVNQIPILAIDELEISKNDSPLYDETIAHRLGLVPIKNDSKSKGKLQLASKREGMVYSGELEGDFKVAYDKIPLTLLEKGQELELVAEVREGKGNEHSKFSPGVLFYKNLSEVKVSKGLLKEFMEKCSKKVIEVKDRVLVDVDFEPDSYEGCIEFKRKNGKDSIQISSTEELLVTVESFGQINPEDILKKAIEVLKKDLADVSKKLSK